MRIALLFILIFRSDDLGCGLFQILWIRGFCHSMLSILHQIYIFINSRLGLSQLGPHAFNCIRTKSSRRTPVKPSRRTPVKPGCHRSTRLWLLSSSYYFSYPMKKLTSITRGGSRLRPTGFSTSLPTVMLKGGKPHALTS